MASWVSSSSGCWTEPWSEGSMWSWNWCVVPDSSSELVRLVFRSGSLEGLPQTEKARRSDWLVGLCGWRS